MRKSNEEGETFLSTRLCIKEYYKNIQITKISENT